MWDIRDGQPVRDLLTGIIGVWQVVFEGRWCVAASNRNDQTWLDVWDFGKDGDDEDWVGEPPSGIYDEDSDGDDDLLDDDGDGDRTRVPPEASGSSHSRRASTGKAPARTPSVEPMDTDDAGAEPYTPSEPGVAEEVERGLGLGFADDESGAEDGFTLRRPAGWSGQDMAVDADFSGPPSSVSPVPPGQHMLGEPHLPPRPARAGPSAAALAHALPAVDETPTKPRIRTGGSRRR
jgi:F-box and WD-40 domain protein CDC4